MYDFELYHHGVKGQKWGVRRYQNKDGSLIEAGQRRKEKYEIKQQHKAQKEELRQRLRGVDPELAKNRQTRRVAYDYHNLTDRQFMARYHTTKKTFLKRYIKTKGDTYSLGLKKAAVAAAIVASSPDVSYMDLRTGQRKTITMGKKKAASLLAQDLLYSEITTRAGYDNAKKRYYTEY